LITVKKEQLGQKEKNQEITKLRQEVFSVSSELRKVKNLQKSSSKITPVKNSSKITRSERYPRNFFMHALDIFDKEGILGVESLITPVSQKTKITNSYGKACRYSFQSLYNHLKFLSKTEVKKIMTDLIIEYVGEESEKYKNRENPMQEIIDQVFAKENEQLRKTDGKKLDSDQFSKTETEFDSDSDLEFYIDRNNNIVMPKLLSQQVKRKRWY